MEHTSEKHFNTKSTFDTFDEIYTSYDLSVDADYSAGSGYPFDYPIRWLNDQSMNKRIAVRRLDVTPSSHTLQLEITAIVNDELDTSDDAQEEEKFIKTITFDITYLDTLIKVMNYICNEFSYRNTFGIGQLCFKHDNTTNNLQMYFVDSTGTKKPLS